MRGSVSGITREGGRHHVHAHVHVHVDDGAEPVYQDGRLNPGAIANR